MYPNLIKHIRNYVDLNETELPILYKYIKTIQVAKKELLLEEGQICKSNYFVEKGCLRMYYINSKAEEQTFQFALENWWMTDYKSLIDKTPSEYFIQAIEKAQIVSLDYQKQEQLFEELPQMERYFHMIMQRVSALTQLRIKNIYELSKEELFLDFSASFPGFVQRVPQYMLASYLGITAEYVSRLRKKKS